VGFVDDKMGEIKGNIDDLIEQSNQLKVKNRELEMRIAAKMKVCEEKEVEMEEVNKELLEARTELEQFELCNLRNNKHNR
jgi:regulator of replication initiation timing